MMAGVVANRMVGARVSSVVELGELGIDLVTDKGSVNIRCEGDCCSVSWFEHLGDASLLVDHVITAVTETDMKDITEQHSRQHPGEYAECVRQYALLIVTTKGVYEMEMRNSSNGYYGGNATFHWL